jgi:mono/diheme cytochrome c family protein
MTTGPSDQINCDLLQRAKIVTRQLIAASLAAPASALAQPLAGHPLVGRQTATALCAPCHQTGKPAMTAPSFVDVANFPSTTALSLRVFLRSSHTEMPNLIISNSETDDLIAYIINLKQPSAPKRP